ncbi:MAG: UPF0489 family protein [Bacteroidetes bacterium]|nr:UPF0489 family protein [Bacteroidota bacterium]
MKTPVDLIPHIRRDTNFIAELYPAFWVMDDHRWAFLAWEKSASSLNKNARYSLIHADYHYDGCNDFESETEITSLLTISDLDKLEAIVRSNSRIRKDSFIAPAVIRELLNSLHFYCLQGDTEPGIDESLLSRFNCTQHLHSSIEKLIAANVSSPLIFDLCLDLFNKSDQWEEGDLWQDHEILEFLEKASLYIERADIVTVSFSFGYSGTTDDTKRLAALVLPIMLGYRGIANT